MTFQMTTISSGTRVRADHTTFAAQIASVGANVVVHGDEVWTAPADGNEVKAGDKWLHVTDAGMVGWMAYIHKGVPICKNLIEDTAPPVDVTPFPEYYIMESPTGVRVRYNKGS